MHRTPLSRAGILDEALRLVDAEGLEALSMRKLATLLGVEAMSLYNHIPSKAALMAGLLQRMLAEIRSTGNDAADWDEALRATALSVRAVARRHSSFVELLTTQQVHTEDMLRPAEDALKRLHLAGFDRDQAIQAYQALIGYVLGSLLQERSGVIGLTCCPSADNGSADAEQRGRALPLVNGIEKEGVPSADESFEFGLDLVISGMRKYLCRTSSSLSPLSHEAAGR